MITFSISALCNALPFYHSISIDSRTLEPGALFIALDGKNFQGADFALNALERGASAVVQSRWKHHHDERIFWAETPLDVLRCLAQNRRKVSKAVFYAITGSVGKTTTKEGLSKILKHVGPTYASASSYNNHIGVPLTLANCPLDAEYAVCEVGTNHPGEIASLVSYVQPDISILTAVSGAHIEHFGSVEAIFQEKCSIFSGKIGVFPEEFTFRDELMKRYPNHDWVTFGLRSGDVHVAQGLEQKKGTLTLCSPQGPVSYVPSSWNHHWIETNMAILATVCASKLDIQSAAEVLSSFTPLKGRGAVRYYDRLGVRCIDESYNAAPQAMQSCLEAFTLAQGRKILVLGEMGELGNHAPALHTALIPYIENVQAEHIFLIGNLFNEVYEVVSQRTPHTRLASDVSEILEELKDSIEFGDTLLLKGKNSAKIWRVLDTLSLWNDEDVSSATHLEKTPYKAQANFLQD